MGEYKNDDFVLVLVNFGGLWETQMEIDTRELHVDIWYSRSEADQKYRFRSY